MLENMKCIKEHNENNALFFYWNIQGVIRNTELWKFQNMESIILGTFQASYSRVNKSLT